MEGANSYKLYIIIRSVISTFGIESAGKDIQLMISNFHRWNSMVHWIQKETNERKKERKDGIDRKIWNIFIAAYVHNNINYMSITY